MRGESVGGDEGESVGGDGGESVGGDGRGSTSSSSLSAKLCKKKVNWCDMLHPCSTYAAISFLFLVVVTGKSSSSDDTSGFEEVLSSINGQYLSTVSAGLAFCWYVDWCMLS